MAQGTKIRWSPGELEAALSPDIFYTKHAVIRKVSELFGELSEDLKTVADLFPGLSEYTDVKSPKLFRGENYLQLPYVVLDYPRKFSSLSVFAFRSMFWWGKEFSFTLHIGGEALAGLQERMNERIHLLNGKGFYLCVNDSPWHYHFEKDNYQPLEKSPERIKMNGEPGRDFIKLSRRLGVSEYERVSAYGMETFRLVGEMIFGGKS